MSRSGVNLSATYARFPRMRDLTGTTIIAHRGGALHVPEHTLEGFRVAVGQGLRAIEPDVHRLADGSLGVMHDGTVDRTTAATGNVADHTAASWKQLNIDASTYLGGGWPDNLRPPLFGELLSEFGGRVILVPEAKTAGSMAAIIDALERRSISKESVLLQSFSASDCDVAVSRGWDVMLLGSTDVANATSKGYEWIGPAYTSITAQLVTDAHAAGIKVAGYTVNRRIDRDSLTAMGVDAIFSDDPAYLYSDAVRRSSDLFARSVWMPGQQANNGDRGKFYTGGYWGWDLNASQANFSTHGYLRPPDLSSFTLDLTLRADAFNASDISRWGSVYLATTDFAFADTAHASNNGYHFLMRGNGQLDIYRVAPGAGAVNIANLPSASGTDLVIGADTPFRITVTPTQVTLARADLPAETITANNGDARGLPFVTFGRNGAGIRFKGVSLT